MWPPPAANSAVTRRLIDNTSRRTQSSVRLFHSSLNAWKSSCSFCGGLGLCRKFLSMNPHWRSVHRLYVRTQFSFFRSVPSSQTKLFHRVPTTYAETFQSPSDNEACDRVVVPHPLSGYLTDCSCSFSKVCSSYSSIFGLSCFPGPAWSGSILHFSNKIITMRHSLDYFLAHCKMSCNII